MNTQSETLTIPEILTINPCYDINACPINIKNLVSRCVKGDDQKKCYLPCGKCASHSTNCPNCHCPMTCNDQEYENGLCYKKCDLNKDIYCYNALSCGKSGCNKDVLNYN